MKIEVNRHGLLQPRGLPVCQIPEIQPASTERALANCGDAVIGSGQFWASIVLPDQGAYRTQGRLLIFNGRKNGRPVLLAHIFTLHSFNSSFAIVFSIQLAPSGRSPRRVHARLPPASWGESASSTSPAARSPPTPRPARSPSPAPAGVEAQTAEDAE